MPVDHTERGFEQAIEDHLLHHGYRKGDPTKSDTSPALDPETITEFLSTTQKDEWKRLSALHGVETGKRVVETIARNLEQRGILDCLRHGVTDRGVTLSLAYFKPATKMNPQEWKGDARVEKGRIFSKRAASRLGSPRVLIFLGAKLAL